jgi:hypothetical protein
MNQNHWILGVYFMERSVIRTAVLAAALVLAGCAGQKTYEWGIHDINRPQPRVVTPGTEDRLPPSDAIVLFDGKNLSAWRSDKDGGAAQWKVENGYMEVVPGTGDILTRQAFGSCQLHIEWATPEVVAGSGQTRGNSGVYPMDRYEVQVLDSYKNDTYPDGMAASIYGQSPPLVNASRGPGQWQSYDIIFRAPVFEGGTLKRPAAMTVLHNGVLVQNHWVLEGLTLHMERARYEPHAAKLPFRIQEHGYLVRYRNIWIRPLED